jgi:hypothetical protein
MTLVLLGIWMCVPQKPTTPGDTIFFHAVNYR